MEVNAEWLTEVLRTRPMELEHVLQSGTRGIRLKKLTSI